MTKFTFHYVRHHEQTVDIEADTALDAQQKAFAQSFISAFNIISKSAFSFAPVNFTEEFKIVNTCNCSKFML